MEETFELKLVTVKENYSKFAQKHPYDFSGITL